MNSVSFQPASISQPVLYAEFPDKTLWEPGIKRSGEPKSKITALGATFPLYNLFAKIEQKKNEESYLKLTLSNKRVVPIKLNNGDIPLKLLKMLLVVDQAPDQSSLFGYLEPPRINQFLDRVVDRVLDKIFDGEHDPHPKTGEYRGEPWYEFFKVFTNPPKKYEAEDIVYATIRSQLPREDIQRIINFADRCYHQQPVFQEFESLPEEALRQKMLSLDLSDLLDITRGCPKGHYLATLAIQTFCDTINQIKCPLDKAGIISFAKSNPHTFSPLDKDFFDARVAIKGFLNEYGLLIRHFGCDILFNDFFDEFLPLLPNLESLDLRDFRYFKEVAFKDLEKLRNIPNLRTLYLPDVSLECLEYIKKILPNLEKLENNWFDRYAAYDPKR